MSTHSREAGPAGGAALAVAWGFVVMVAGYALLRAGEAIGGPAAEPSSVFWSTHAGYFWRAGIVGYAGGMASFVAWLLVRAYPRSAGQALAPALAIATSLLVLQTFFWP